MTRSPRRNITRCTGSVLFGLMTLLACAGNLDGPTDCIFAYEIEPSSFSVNVGDSVAVRANPVANCGGPQSVTWTVEDGTKATLRTTGSLTAVVYGVAKGYTILNAENSGKTGFTIIEVR